MVIQAVLRKHPSVQQTLVQLQPTYHRCAHRQCFSAVRSYYRSLALTFGFGLFFFGFTSPKMSLC